MQMRPRSILLLVAGLLVACAPGPIDHPIVDVETDMGHIMIELDAINAPKTTENFLRYVREQHYSNGEFFRTVTDTNQPDSPIKIAVVQAQADVERPEFEPIELERTSDTGLSHLDGTISMARDGPDTATHSFFICVGDQPDLDHGGMRNPDGQGFAAFGRVVDGMDIIRQIHQAPAEGQTLLEPIKIKSVIRER
jgi:peptidyl-prolyl cis-trans isomerase A (cyclophilin A)